MKFCPRCEDRMVTRHDRARLAEVAAFRRVVVAAALGSTCRGI
jgi:hypothetical protein